MILGIGFLLMVSLIINAALAFAGKWMSSLLPATSVMLQLAAELASLGVITVLFAAMFRILPSAKINWGDVVSRSCRIRDQVSLYLLPNYLSTYLPIYLSSTTYFTVSVIKEKVK
jgi:uncharacterized BrkB/YihY/UPF0761 family membrane protein